ncbi:LOW QUALITY PROTEIN: hypothetical protein U9M48_040505 [Paspalum notatum var. saurae]|uniref:ATP-dependent DNA helicase n=1 Tax=Paspalum notatum var. saurae TaxID=547442 RepID=A0AAQ3UR82_PASNO
MRDIMNAPDRPFGRKTIVFGGDFRQVLPVIRKGSRAQIVDASLCRSYLWESMRHLKLVRNMRAQSDPWFVKYLFRYGIEEDDGDGYIHLLDEICVSCTGEDTDLHRLIEDVFPMLNDNMTDPDYITSRAILSTRNDCVDRINMRMIHRFRAEEMVYHSFDRAEDDPHIYYPPEFLNSLTPNGLPPHVLRLKINSNGLCNGTRLIVRSFQKNAIDAEIVLRQHARKRFPIRLSFAMMINKAQGQTISHAGVNLPEPMLSHGQLYVALSRATARSNIKVLAAPDDKDKKNKRSRQGKTKKKTTSIVGRILRTSAPSLKSLCLISCQEITQFEEEITKFPLLEELEISLFTNIGGRHVFEAVGKSCLELKHFRFNSYRFINLGNRGYSDDDDDYYDYNDKDDDALGIASMHG